MLPPPCVIRVSYTPQDNPIPIEYGPEECQIEDGSVGCILDQTFFPRGTFESTVMSRAAGRAAYLRRICDGFPMHGTRIIVAKEKDGARIASVFASSPDAHTLLYVERQTSATGKIVYV